MIESSSNTADARTAKDVVAPCASPCYRDRVSRFVYRDELPPEDQCGLGHSPRRSHLDTAVVLSPEDYDALLQCRDDLQGRVKAPQKLYDILCDLREAIGCVRDSKTVTVQNDVEELDRLAGVANRAIGMLIDSSR